MNLKNYTSQVPVFQTISRIEYLLIQAGAKAIGKDYENAKVSSVTFQLSINGKDQIVRLPANIQKVNALLRKAYPKRSPESVLQQAERTAWKLQQDWLEIELSLIQMQQKEAGEVFMAYLWDGQRSYYALAKERGYLAMLPEKSEAA